MLSSNEQKFNGTTNTLFLTTYPYAQNLIGRFRSENRRKFEINIKYSQNNNKYFGVSPKALLKKNERTRANIIAV